MTTQIMALALGYFMCSAAAQDPNNAQSHDNECAHIRTQLTVAFTEVETLEEYRALSETDRQRLNQRGLQAFQRWTSQNPRVVASLRSKAQVSLSRFGF
ncbi:MAG: hypothetical protein JXR13_15405 [Thalassovita sp.]